MANVWLRLHFGRSLYLTSGQCCLKQALYKHLYLHGPSQIIAGNYYAMKRSKALHVCP